MRKIRMLLSLLLLALTGTATAVAQTFPFALTTIEDGKFATNTTWYTLQIGASGLFISDNAEAEYIKLATGSTELADADLWCFVGSAEEGIAIYNKAAGTAKRLASPKTMTGTTGATAYVVLKEDGDDNYSYLWDFTSSSNLGETASYYIAQHGVPANKINNRDAKLAFWTGGADAGSSVVVDFAEQTLEVNLTTGTFTAGNANNTYFSVWSSNEMDGFTLGTGVNNMARADNYIAGYSGLDRASTYTLTAPAERRIAGYTFDFANTGADASYTLMLEANGTTYTSSTTKQHVAVSDLTERTATFKQTGENKGLTFTDFFVTIQRTLIPSEPFFEVFPCAGSEIPYRIPAITTASNGDIIAVADYRHSRADIGMAKNGRIDLRGRISKDHGQTWGEIFDIVRGQGASSPDSMHVGFGDPCIVADRESSRVMVMSCAGNVSFPNGTREIHQNMVRFYSDDYGQTWTEPEDVAPSVYAQFDKSPFGPVKAMFIGSGKISQSKTIKVGEYYRLYCAVLVKDVSGANINFVLYSDDFGGSWTVLGGTDVTPIPSGGDEPKAEELPDGSVIISSRTTGGRLFNIFSYTDIGTAKGFWGNMTSSSASGNNGIGAIGNSTNGEILFVPAVRKSDNTPVYLALQSVPFGSGRANVGIYYKELEGLSDFSSSENFAKDWDGRHQSSYLSSAYSTMTWQANNTLGFLYEEDLYSCSGGYTITYKNYSLEQITDSAYTYNTEGIDGQLFIKDGVQEKANAMAAKTGKNVGMLTEDGAAAINAAYEAYAAEPAVETYVALNNAISNADRVRLEEYRKYRIRNYDRDNGTLYLTTDGTELTAEKLNESNTGELFHFVSTEDGYWTIQNEGISVSIGATGAIETKTPVVTSVADAAPYAVTSNEDGLSKLRCMTPTNATYSYLHLAGDKARIVPWAANSPAANGASFWYIEPTDIVVGIEAVASENPTKDAELYDLSGRRVAKPVRGALYVTGNRRKVFVK